MVTVINTAMISNNRAIPPLRLEVIQVALLRAVSVVLLFVMNLLLAHALSVQEYGLFSFAFTVASSLALFASLGFPTALMRLVPPALDTHDYPIVKGVLIRSYQITFLCALLLALLLAAASSFISSQGLLYAAMLLPGLTLLALHNGAFRALHQTREGLFWGQLALLLMMMLFLALVAMSHVGTVLMFFVALASTIALLGLFRLRYVVSQQIRSSKAEYKMRVWFYLALPMAAVAGFQFLIDRVDVVLLGFISDMQTTGVYHAASRVAALISFILVAINLIFAPRLSSAFHAGDMQHFGELIRLSIRWSSMAALPLLLMILVWPGYLLGLFGNDFVIGTSILQVLALAQFVNALTGATGIALVMIDRHRLVAIGLLVAVILQVSLSVLVFPHYGAPGIAVVTTVISAGLNISWYITIKQVMHRTIAEQVAT